MNSDKSRTDEDINNIKNDKTELRIPDNQFREDDDVAMLTDDLNSQTIERKDIEKDYIPSQNMNIDDQEMFKTIKVHNNNIFYTYYYVLFNFN